jgi:hypothetical protein
VEVELVGGESWLRENSVAVAAIFAAIVAATVSVLNQRSQLKHDRYLRNRDHVRDAIDNAIVVANEVRTAVDRLAVKVTGLEEERDEMDADELTARAGQISERQEVALTKLHSMRAARSRLEIRFGEKDPVLEEYQTALDAFIELSREINQGLVDNRSEELLKKESELEEAALSSLVLFQEACRDWFNDGRTRGLLGGRRRRSRRGSDADS